MRTPEDALRSVARYVAVALGSEFEVRMSGEKGVFQRPSARVQQVPSLQMLTPRWNAAKLIASYNVIVWPAAGSEPDASQLEALRVVDLLWVAFAGPGVGNPAMRAAVDSTRGRPYRVPLYDYDGVPLGGMVDESRRDRRDFLHLEAPPEVTTYQDPDDERLYSVAANIRMSWLRSAAVLSGHPTTEHVSAGANTNG